MTGDEISNGSFEEEKYNDTPDLERRLSNNNGDQEFESNSAAEMLRDPHGLPLVPQPSRFKDDPLNWPAWLKWAVLLQVSFMAFLGIYSVALINPSIVLLSKAMHVDSKTAAYSTTTAIIIGGVSPFILTPISDVYGRRPVTLFALLITTLGSVGSGRSMNFATLVGTRAMTGFGIGGLMSVGTAVVNDMFFLHERGEKTGVYSIFVTNGAHVAALIGGYLGQAAGWQWDYYLAALTNAFVLLIALFLLPETLFCRTPSHLLTHTPRTYLQLLFSFRRPTRTLHPSSFLASFYMLKYPSILFPFWYYTWTWTFINVLPAITLATIYTHFYHLSSGPIGACLGISLIVGSILGEFFAGRASDYLMYTLARRNAGVRTPEHRLYLCTLSAIFMPSGLLIFGATVGHASYIVPLIGLAVGVFGLQIATTTMYAYISDAYNAQTSLSGTLLNLSRGLSFVVGFFALPFAGRVGYLGAWGTFAGVLGVAFLPVGSLVFWGEGWRRKLGEPSIK